MRILVIVLAALLGGAIAFGGLIFAASELGGEGVTLHTVDGSGGEHTTSLWVVELDGAQYLRGGDGASGWVQRLRENPEVRVERGGEVAPYRAVIEPGRVREIDALMAEKYGAADAIIDVIRDPAQSVAVRLEPIAAER